ncbi:MAG: hypothetical protein ACKOZV_13055 [Bacteroidota bacterium]
MKYVNNWISVILCLTLLVVMASCSAAQVEASSRATGKSPGNHAGNTVLTNMYIRAIRDYMDGVYQKDSTLFDTLYFADRKTGGPDDFPDITLPREIGKTKIVMLPVTSAYEAPEIQFEETKPLINLMGWIDETKAEFIFVIFFPGYHHRYDCHINYSFLPVEKDYQLEKLTIEVLMGGENGKAGHFSIYQKGKHVGNRAIEERQ